MRCTRASCPGLVRPRRSCGPRSATSTHWPSASSARSTRARPRAWATRRCAAKYLAGGRLADPYHRAIPDGESWADLYHRVGGRLFRVAMEHPGETVVVAGHGGTVGASFVAFGQTPMRRATDIVHTVANASITEWVGDGDAWRLVRFNDAAHLHVALSPPLPPTGCRPVPSGTMADDPRTVLAAPPRVPSDVARFTSEPLFGEPGIYPDGPALRPAAGHRHSDASIEEVLVDLVGTAGEPVFEAWCAGRTAVTRLTYGVPVAPGRVVGPDAGGTRVVNDAVRGRGPPPAAAVDRPRPPVVGAGRRPRRGDGAARARRVRARAAARARPGARRPRHRARPPPELAHHHAAELAPARRVHDHARGSRRPRHDPRRRAGDADARLLVGPLRVAGRRRRSSSGRPYARCSPRSPVPGPTRCRTGGPTTSAAGAAPRGRGSSPSMPSSRRTVRSAWSRDSTMRCR